MSSFVLLSTPFYAIYPPFQEVLSGNPTLGKITTWDSFEFQKNHGWCPTNTLRQLAILIVNIILIKKGGSQAYF